MRRAKLLAAFLPAYIFAGSALEASVEGKGANQTMTTITYRNPVWNEYFADPAVAKFRGEYYAYGTSPRRGVLEFPVLRSSDLVHWDHLGECLLKIPDRQKTAYWAPEVVEKNGKYYMYFSAGGPAGENHQLRVAVAGEPQGPFKDQGIVLMPDEPFSIDAHPFLDPKSGKWYLFFAKDFFDGRAGTGVAVVELGDDMKSVCGPIKTVVRASADWQIFERNRQWYGKTWDAWHTVEGPAVVFHEGKYYCIYSGGRWESADYGLGYALADEVTGPYEDLDDAEGPSVLKGNDKFLGPGHNSTVLGPDGKTLFCVYHAWDDKHTARRMCIDPIVFKNGKPRVDGPSTQTRSMELVINR